MNPVLFVLLAAQAAASPSATPTPTPRLNILLSRPGSEMTAPTGSLADVAKRIKLKLPEGQPRIITNDRPQAALRGRRADHHEGCRGLRRYAPVGQATGDQKKAIWQQRYRGAVLRVTALEAEIKRLEGEANRLEREFYAHDDPAQRDGVIKPAWDRADGRPAQGSGRTRRGAQQARTGSRGGPARRSSSRLVPWPRPGRRGARTTRGPAAGQPRPTPATSRSVSPGPP